MMVNRLTSAHGLKLAVFIILICLVALPRLWPQPATFLAPDEMKIGIWVSEMSQAILAGEWPKTAIPNNPYPAITFAWLEAIQARLIAFWSDPTPWVSNAPADVFAAMPHRRFNLALFNSLMIFAVGGLLARLYNRKVALTAILLMALDPFFLTESRVFRTEGITTGLMMLSALTLIIYTQAPRKRWLIASGCLAGLAALTRISALYLVPFAGLVLLGGPLLRGDYTLRRLGWQTGRDFCIWSLITGVTFVGLWPAFWVSPLDGPATIYGALASPLANTTRVWEHGVFFQGKPMGEVDPGLAFYLWALAYRTTPALWLGLFAVAVRAALYLVKKYRQPGSSRWVLSPTAAVTTLIFAYLFFYFVAMNLSVTKIDRYLVAMLPGLSSLAALGFWFIATHWPGLSKYSPGLRYGVLWGGLFAAGAWVSLPHHPIYYTYWNPLLGGGPAAVNILPVTFRLGIDPAIDYLNDLPEAETVNLAGSALDMDQDCQVIFKGTCLEQAKFLAADYFLLTRYTSQHELAFSNIQTIIPDLALVHTVNKAGVDYSWLYKMPEGIQYVGHWLDPQSGSFAGYRLATKTVGAGETVEVTLFWWTGEKNGWRFPDSDLFVKVLDETGRVQQRVVARVKPEFAAYLSQPEETLVFTAPLTFPEDTALGSYQLEMGLSLKETGEETFQFPLDNTEDSLTVNRGVLADPAEPWSVPQLLRQAVGDTGLSLLGYALPTAKSTDQPELTTPIPPQLDLYWQTQTPLTENYEVVLELLDQQGQVVTNWRRALGPEFHPATAWQPGEVVKLPFALETGSHLPPEPYQLHLLLLRAGGSEAITTIDLSQLVGALDPSPPNLSPQYRVDRLTFGQTLDLLGYDLTGRNEAGNETGGTLFVNLYWVNRDLTRPVEVQLQALTGKGEVIDEQILPAPPPWGLTTWQSVSYYQLSLSAVPTHLKIRARPVGSEQWSLLHNINGSGGDTFLIDEVLSKTVIVANE